MKIPKAETVAQEIRMVVYLGYWLFFGFLWMIGKIVG